MEKVLTSLDFRNIGPTRGGRCITVTAHPTNQALFYMGTTGGGVWTSGDAGTYWQNVSDGFFKRASVGAIAIAPSDPNVIYVGMGESTIRGNVSHGDGVYKSTDGGQTWTNIGLSQIQNMGRIAVHPTNPDIVYVAAFGRAWGPSADRGLYRSMDGGATWDRILYISDRSGANFVTLDPNNPRNVYVCFWDAQRGPYYLDSGGPGSGIYRSSDGGDSWERLDDKPGMPDGDKGKMEIAVSAREGRIWAIVESQPEQKKNGIYRSEDYGQTWQHLTSDTNLTGRPWYFNHIRADPQDADTLWVLNFEIWRSVDGGKNYQVMAGPHADYHDLWIDPTNTQRMILGGDGGACVSLNGAESWSTIYNQPTAEFYHATTDNRFPYRVYGAQQDNTTMSIISRSDNDAITLTEWYEVGGGESGYIAVSPTNPNVILAGAQSGMLTRYDHERKQELDIAVWPESPRGHGAEDYKFRTNWTSPMVHSPHDPTVVYYGSHVVHKTTSEGRAWDVISPDLTRADPETMHASGGNITKDNSGAEIYATVFTIAPSTLDANVIWAGSDDGLVHVTRDGGATWDDATPSTIPDWALMSIIEASPHDAATAYLAATRYKSDDFQPYLYKTSDYGKTWTKITNGIPGDDFTRVIREDPTRKGLLYAGTETGIYVSFDDGGNWQKLGGNLPVVPIHDLIIKDNELLICTHGRAFWIMDDLTIVRQLADTGTAPKASYLFQPKGAIRSKKLTGFGNTEVKGKNYLFVSGIVQTYVPIKDQYGNNRRRFLDAGQNPDDGVVIYYWLADKPSSEISLTIFDHAGNEVRSFKSKTEKADNDDKTPKIPAIGGLNRFVWDMRVGEATKLEAKGGDQPATTGPRVIPGDYTLRLTSGSETHEQPFKIVPDPRHATTTEEFQAQYDLLLQVRDKLTDTNDAINRVRRVRDQVDGWIETAKGSKSEKKLADAAKALKEKLSAAEEQLIQVNANSPKDTLHYPVMLNTKLVRVANAIASAEMAPTRQAREVFADLSTQVDAQIAAINTAIDKDVPAFNKLVAEANLDAIVIGGER